MKKKVLFMVINMNIGGTEKALLNMINEMPKNEYDTTVLMLEEYGGFLSNIPEWVDIKYFNGYKKIKSILNNPPIQTIKQAVKNKTILHALTLLVLYLFSKLTGERSALFKYLLKKYPIDPTEYDVAIAYAGPMDFISYFVIEKIKAKKKVQWIHFDITKIGFNMHFALKMYRKFDRISVVSNEARDKLLKKIPVLAEKTVLFKNIISTKEIRKLASNGESFNDFFDGIRIVTVGRLTDEKGQDLAIKALSKLINNGYKVKWYCIGEGKSRKKYEKQIEENKLRDYFFLLGTKTNPYPFIKDCDIYVQPSRYEGYCITTLEARCLNKPILTTEVNGANEQFINGETGVIVGINEEEIFKGVSELITNNCLRQKLISNLKLKNEKHEGCDLLSI